MDALTLIKPTLEYGKDIMAYRQEFSDTGDVMHGCSGLEKYDNCEQWLARMQLYEHEETCPAMRVPETLFVCIRNSDQKIVGMLDLRHKLIDSLLRTGGHIGYSIRPSERKKGYGTRQLMLALEKCRDIHLNRVLVTCDQENIASAKIIQRCGGMLENEVFDPSGNTVTQRYWIFL